MKNAINWFEIPTLDFERAKAFYSKIYDYEMQEWPMPDGPRLGLLPSAQEPDAVGGAIIQHEKNQPVDGGVLVYLNGGDDLQVILDRVPEAGGEMVLPKTRITEEIGYMALFKDTEGNLLGLHSRG